MIFLVFSAFLGMIISSVIVTYLVIKELDFKNPKPISQLVLQSENDLIIFRVAIFLGGSLIAATVFLFIAPKIEFKLGLIISFSVMYFSELMLGVIPDKNGKDIFQYSSHNVFAWSGFLGAIATTMLLGFALSGIAARAEFAVVASMLILSLMVIYHRKGFLYYELLFIFMSHISILIAVIALYYYV